MKRPYLGGAVSDLFLSGFLFLFFLATKCLPGAAVWIPYMDLSGKLGF